MLAGSLCGGMFNGVTVINQSLSFWDAANVKDIEAMFSDAKEFDQDLAAWNVTKVIYIYEFDVPRWSSV
jgi:Mycoplasma protein of unknown function, DUF285